MRNILTVDKKQLLEIYDGKLLGYVDVAYDGNKLDLSGILADKIEIKVLNKMGPFSTVYTVNTTNNRSRFIVPTSLIQKEEVPNALDLFKPILDLYHKDHWVYDSGHVYIHYPILTIKNSLNQSHTIEDLLIRFDVDITGNIHSLLGNRCSWTAEEIRTGYSHSHLAGSRGRWETFCMGSGTTFDDFYKNLRKVNSPAEFELFLIQLEQYLSWESLEGTPYVSISNFYTSQANEEYGPEIHNIMSDIIKDIAINWLKIPQVTLLLNDTYPYAFDPSMESEVACQQEITLAARYCGVLQLEDYLFDWDTDNLMFVWSNNNSVDDDIELPKCDYLPSELKIVPRLLPSKTIEKGKSNTVKRFCPSLLIKIAEQINLYILNGIRTPISTERSVVPL